MYMYIRRPLRGHQAQRTRDIGLRFLGLSTLIGLGSQVLVLLVPLRSSVLGLILIISNLSEFFKES